MPSPFPGMNPYLEHPALWPGVHQGLIGCMRATLNEMLSPRYVADIGERLYVVQPERDIYPDVVVLEHPSSETPREQSAGGTAVAAVARGVEVVASDPPWVMTVEPVEMREVFIEILSVVGEERVVTVIEVLSPSNKTKGSEGRELYVTKQRELLGSQTHVIEIDLLREGAHTVAAPRGHLLRRGKWDYLVCLHRGGQGGRYEVWAVPLRQKLPRICVPLADGDPDAVLDLQEAFSRCYDEGAYARRLDYRGDPPEPLQPDAAAWADALLRERGLRG